MEVHVTVDEWMKWWRARAADPTPLRGHYQSCRGFM